jgi:hypothetical protein
MIWLAHRPLFHTTLDDTVSRVLQACFLNHPAGGDLVAVQPIGSMHLADFDAARSHRHGGLSWLRRRPAMTIPFEHTSFADGRLFGLAKNRRKQLRFILISLLSDHVRTAAAARMRTLPLNDRANPDGHGRQVVTATNTDHSHTLPYPVHPISQPTCLCVGLARLPGCVMDSIQWRESW